MNKNNGILSTTTYDMFKIIKGNRNIYPSHVADLTLSITQENLLAQNPILVNEKMEIIDGQHRLEVAKNNKLEIFYLVIPGTSIDQVIMLNAHKKSWNAKDYIDSYVSRGKEDYIWLKNFMDDYQLTVTQAVIFMVGGENSHLFDIIKKGTFRIVPETRERAIDRADLFHEIRPYIRKKGMLPKSFIVSVTEMADEGVGRNMMDNIIKSGKTITPELDKLGNRRILSRYISAN